MEEFSGFKKPVGIFKQSLRPAETLLPEAQIN